VSPLRDEKPIFGPLSKNNTGMAALPAGLPVTRNLSGTNSYRASAAHTQLA